MCTPAHCPDISREGNGDDDQCCDHGGTGRAVWARSYVPKSPSVILHSSSCNAFPCAFFPFPCAFFPPLTTDQAQAAVRPCKAGVLPVRVCHLHVADTPRCT